MMLSTTSPKKQIPSSQYPKSMIDPPTTSLLFISNSRAFTLA